MMEDDLAIGDRVERAPFHGEASRIGTVQEVSHTAPSTNGKSVALYAVQWDDQGWIERNYLRGGLVKCSVQARPTL